MLKIMIYKFASELKERGFPHNFSSNPEYLKWNLKWMVDIKKSEADNKLNFQISICF